MTHPASPVSPPASYPRSAYAALLFGACGMGMSPMFVRFAAEAGVGPYASAFWRVFLALPFLWVWARIEEGGGSAKPTFHKPMIWAGLLFSCDLFFWHLSILRTSIANATFLSTTAPVWVLLVSVVVLKQKAKPATLGGLALCLLGGSSLIGDTLSLAPERLMGDLFGLMTAVFFGLYFFGIKYARDLSGAGRSTFAASAVAAMVLLVALATQDQLLPSTLKGAASLLLMAMISQALGQGLLSVALGRLPTVFSALVIFLEAVAAAALGWIVLDEALSPLQWLGGGLILCGIFIARPRHTDTHHESDHDRN